MRAWANVGVQIPGHDLDSRLSSCVDWALAGKYAQELPLSARCSLPARNTGQPARCRIILLSCSA